MLKVLVDEDMPRPVTALLRSLGIDVADVRDVGLKGSTDSEVIRYAREHKMILLSRDKEFANILRYPPGSHCGVIWVNLPYTFLRKQILDAVEKFLVRVERDKLPNNLTILQTGKYRIRQLR